MSRTYGSYMLQPTKDEYRCWLSQAKTELREARDELKQEKTRRADAEEKLELTRRKLGRLVLDGTLSVPLEKLGELALEAIAQEELDNQESPALSES